MNTDELVFDDDGERKLEGELLLLFEGLSWLDPSEQMLIEELIKSVMLKHDAKQDFQQDASA